MNRHCFAIMTHDQFALTESLVALLEHPSSTIVLHINADDPAAIIREYPKLKNAILVPQMPVQWGSFSLLRVQLSLIRAALTQGCDYVHLLSGKDLPLRPVEEILTFVDARDGTDFVHVNPAGYTKGISKRVSRYYSRRLLKGKLTPGFRGVAMRAVQQGSIAGQGILRVDRGKNWGREIHSGSTWFSVTAALAQRFVDNEHWAMTHLDQTFVPEEFFFASIALSTNRSSCLYRGEPGRDSNLRHIQWDAGNRGHPRTYTMADINELAASGNMFARKFDATVDADVIDAVLAQAAGS